MYTSIRLAILVTLFNVGAYAQSGLGSITGTVTDSTEARLPGATVRVVQLSTNTERVTLTNEAGLFNIPSLVASDYSLTIELPGFKQRKLASLTLNAFQNLALGMITLEVEGAPATTIDVTAEAPLIQTENGIRATAIQSAQVTEMPAQGRNWSTLLKIIPGAAPVNNQGIVGRELDSTGYNDFRVNGKDGRQTQMNLDGGSNVDHGNDGKTTVTPSLESIQEVSVLTNNFQAEYGIRAGVVVNVVTKSGSNNWHGTAWDYLRNEVLNANSADNNFLGVPRPKYRYNYFGGNLGGPIKRDKLFFFFNQENTKVFNPSVAEQTRVPTALERIGDFSQTFNPDGTRPTIYMPGTQAAGSPTPVPGMKIPASLLSPLGLAIANTFPEPNYAGTNGINYLNILPNKDRRWLNVGRVDWNVDDKTRAYVRYSHDIQRLRNRGPGSVGFMPFNLTGWNRTDVALTANVTHIFTPALVNETMLNYQKDDVNSALEIAAYPDKVDRTKVGLGDLPLPFQTPLNILPQFTNTGWSDYGFPRFPWRAIAPEWQFSSNWTWTHGTHVIKTGIQFIQNKKNEKDTSNQFGLFNFAVDSASNVDMGYAPANLLTGAVSQFQQVNNEAHKYSIYRDVHFFIQDTWKATSKLTLDYGVRLYHIPSEYNTNPSRTLDAVFVPSLYDPRKAPRYYIVNPANTRTLIDPAFPNNPLPPTVFSALLYSLVPGSGDPLDGVVPLGSAAAGRAGIRDPRAVLFAPRGGFAWQALPKTVFRGGFGWSYNRPTITQAINNFENGLADQIDYRQTSLATLSNPGVKRLSPRSFGVLDESSNKVPTIYDYSLSVQRELPGGFVLDVAYIGNVQQHQIISFNINAVPAGAGFDPKYIDPRLAGNNFAGPVTASNPGPLPGTRLVDSNLMRPYQGFNTLTQISNVGNNRYNSLQTNITKRMSNGLSLQVVHTYGKLISGIENPGLWSYRWKDYTGYQANNDRAHNVTINYVYDVPSLPKRLGWNNGFARQALDGWSVAHIISFLSGMPTTPMVSSTNPAGFSLTYANSTQPVANLNTIFTGSPDLAPRLQPTSNPNKRGSDPYHMFDINAFALPDTGNPGLGSRNYLWLQGTISNDVTVRKTFPIHESMGMELRASFFNLFNNTRRQTLNVTNTLTTYSLNTSVTYKMKGAQLSDGYSIFNSPEQLRANLQASNPNASAQDLYNQYRQGFGSTNLTSVLDPRRIEIGMRFKF